LELLRRLVLLHLNLCLLRLLWLHVVRMGELASVVVRLRGAMVLLLLLLLLVNLV